MDTSGMVYFTMMITELRKILDEEIKPLVNN